jgi:dienelactone hydrolase
VESFESLSDRIAERYAAGRFREALEDLDRRAAEHPDHVADLTFFRACLVSLLGRPVEAVEALRVALDRGSWWAEPMLRQDPDLETARAVRGFDAIADESASRWRAAFAGEVVSPIVAEPPGQPRAVLVVLQGGLRGTVEDVRDAWRPAVDEGCMVAVPGRGQPITSDALDRRNWFDDDATDRAVGAILSDPGWSDLPVLLAGFSAGGRQAMRIAFDRSFDLRGLLLVAPAVRRSDPTPSALAAAASRGVRVCAWVGNQDPLARDVTRLIESLRAAGVMTTQEVIEGLGHRVPDDLAWRLRGALAFLLGETRG